MQYTIRQIAEGNGCSPRLVQKMIKQHPELGIVTEERKKTYLSQHQAAQLSALLAQKIAEKSAHLPQNAQKSENNAENSARADQESAETNPENGMITQEVAELRIQIATLRANLEAKDALIEAKDAEIGRLVDSQAKDREDIARMTAEFASTVKQLESAEAKAASAQAEAESYRPSLFGFYRKERK